MKSKLVSRNPVLRFKLGKLILFALNGLGRWFYNGKEVFSDDGGKTFKLNESGRLTGAPGAIKNLVRADKVGKGAYKVGNSWYKIGGNGRPAVVTETPLKAIRLKNGSMIYKMPDGTWRNEKGLRLENFVSHLLAPIKKEVPTAGKPVGRNTLAATPPQSTVTPSPSLSTVLFTPGIINNGQFTPTGETTTLFNKTSLIPLFKPKPLETFGPGTFNTNVTYNSGNIRANRGVNYSNVNEYWDYLNNNKDSNDYKLFLNIMRTTDGNLNRDVFDLTMAKYGISGNLGRRDSGRLANLLNDLNLIGTEGSDARNSFIDSYNNHFNLALKEAPVKQWTPQGQDWRSNLLNVLSLSYRKKGGTLSSRNPITRFKANFRLVALKTGGEIQLLKKGGYKPYKWKETLPNPILLKNLKETSDKILAADKRAAQFRKASTRANRDTKAPLLSNNLAALQDLLWKIGAFKGIKDRRGRESTYETAVDGIEGRMTRAAIANAQKMGYNLGENGLLDIPTQLKNFLELVPTNESPGVLNNLTKAYNITKTVAKGTAKKALNKGREIKHTVENTVDFMLNNPGLLLLEDMGRSNVNRVTNKTLGIRPIPGRTIESLPSLQTEELKKLVQFAKSKGKAGFDADMYKLMYGHEYTSSKGEGGQDRSGLWNRMNTPKGRLEHTLGSYGFYVDEDGNTIVHDIYDYNVNLHLGGNTRYAVLRNFAGEFASKSTDPNEGKIKYRINLGKLD